ncbi:hypothetical protein LAU_0362 [Lausannevirus]|uniref:Uncharacterized protein n=1 Tax=Lausannevirus TaxID=999883 RepID=F2WLT9_9VIRU|nr:hypothetical protein LAU_0362 [Lausannevirus]AEA07212.1 hypothetical protein LAU_0362 [Lausannevirus]
MLKILNCKKIYRKYFYGMEVPSFVNVRDRNKVRSFSLHKKRVGQVFLGEVPRIPENFVDHISFINIASKRIGL